jgi:hypothetical protein
MHKKVELLRVTLKQNFPYLKYPNIILKFLPIVVSLGPQQDFEMFRVYSVKVLHPML